MDLKLLTLATALLLGLSNCAPAGGYPLGRQEYFMDMPIDHFSSGGDSPTFKMRYLVDAQYWNPSTGPILFYAGNEGDLKGFWDNSGFITKTLAQKFNGLVVFAEHRYFGESFPFDKQSAFYTANNTYLTVDQVMMDYNTFIKSIRYQYGAVNKPCIVFGGSYGGMLASWLRMKYPQTFQGALASSAPILYFKGSTTTTEEQFGDIITEAYFNVSSKCSSTIKEGWTYLTDLRNTSSRQGDWKDLQKVFNTCDPIQSQTDIDDLYYHLMNGFSYMAMTNYPYSTSFLNPMPAWPVNVSCNYFADFEPATEEELKRPTLGGLSDRETQVFTAILKAVNVYFNADSSSPNCTDFKDTDGTGQLDGAGWNVLACNQLAMPTTNGPNSMFIDNTPFPYDTYTQQCSDQYKLTPRYEWVWDYFGGNDIQRDFQAHTNIIFSNGQLDPWRAGGLNDPIQGNDKIHIIYIGQAAHHLDLREPNSEDPQDVIDARNKEIEIIQSWIDEYNGKK